MNFFRKLLMITLLGVVGCQLSEESDPMVESFPELRKALRENLNTPLGELKTVLSYQGHFLGRLDHYYDQNDKISLIFVLNEAGNDTSSVRFYLYDELGKLITENSYFVVEEGYKLGAIKNFRYDEHGRLIQIVNAENENIFKNHFNEKGQLIKTELGKHSEVEFYIYEYDDQNRISKFQWMGGGSSPIMEYFYRYNEKGLLEAKEAGAPIQVPDVEQRQDAFKYFYNEKDQLILEREFYPQWDFTLWKVKKYEYYTVEEVTGL